MVPSFFLVLSSTILEVSIYHFIYELCLILGRLFSSPQLCHTTEGPKGNGFHSSCYLYHHTFRQFQKMYPPSPRPLGYEKSRGGRSRVYVWIHQIHTETLLRCTWSSRPKEPRTRDQPGLRVRPLQQDRTCALLSFCSKTAIIAAYTRSLWFRWIPQIQNASSMTGGLILSHKVQGVSN